LKELLFVASCKNPTERHHIKKDTVQKLRIITGTAQEVTGAGKL